MSIKYNHLKMNQNNLRILYNYYEHLIVNNK